MKKSFTMPNSVVQIEFQCLPEGDGHFVRNGRQLRQQQIKQHARQPAEDHPREKAQLKNPRRRIQMIAPTKTGKNPTMAQLSAMPAP